MTDCGAPRHDGQDEPTPAAQRVHLALPRRVILNGYTMAACTEITANWTIDTSSVTCGNCSRTLTFTELTA